MSALEKLPTEIFAEAASFFDRESILNCRLLNRNISNALNHVFIQQFFRCRAVFINTDSLNILRQISLSERCRAWVTVLDICIHHTLEARLQFEL